MALAADGDDFAIFVGVVDPPLAPNASAITADTLHFASAFPNSFAFEMVFMELKRVLRYSQLIIENVEFRVDQNSCGE